MRCTNSINRIQRDRQAKKVLLLEKFEELHGLKLTISVAEKEIASHKLAVAKEKCEAMQARVNANREYYGVRKVAHKTGSDDDDTDWYPELEASSVLFAESSDEELDDFETE